MRERVILPEQQRQHWEIKGYGWNISNAEKSVRIRPKEAEKIERLLSIWIDYHIKVNQKQSSSQRESTNYLYTRTFSRNHQTLKMTS